jgi:hypothetical protein
MRQLDRLPQSIEVDGDQRSLVPQLELCAGILVEGILCSRANHRRLCPRFP